MNGSGLEKTKKGKNPKQFPLKNPNNPEQSGIACYFGYVFLVRRPFYPAGNKKNPEQSVFIRVQGFCMSLFGATRPVFVPIGKSFPCYFVRLGVGSLPRSQSFHPFQKHSVGYPSFPATYNLH